jgi:hypothetical protein
VDGHGNINAHIIAGFNNRTGFPHADGSGFRFGLGVAPFVKVGSSVIFDPNTFTFPNFNNLQARAYNDGARISSNSWGAPVGGAYNSDSQAYDTLVRDAQPAASVFPTAGNQEMVIIFAAGNDGPGANTVGAPGTGKNMITIGASENVQAFGGADGSGVSDTGANNLNDIIGFSSRGPLDDSRVKPDLVGPGTHVSGGVWQQNPIDTGNGVADPAFNGTGVSGGVGGANFFPAGQQFYTASSGTSHSTPAVAGGAALVRQYFINQGLTPPSPAMTKAYLLNATRYLTGTGANDTLFSNNQGMGLMNLGTAFDGVARVLRDQVAADMFTATGQARVFTGVISDPSKPFRVSLTWTDAPGATVGNAFNNNLDLIVTIGGNTYQGNVFSGANSTTGGAADLRNNVESVFLPAGVSGSFVVRVQAANINSNGVPNVGGALDQDFALVIYNATSTFQPFVTLTGSNLVSESFTPANGAPDPGEFVTANFDLQNIGAGNTTNLVATLQPTGGVIPVTTAQTYGVLTAGGAPVGRPFTFLVDKVLACGSKLTATLQLQDGATDLGSVAFGFTLGTTIAGSTVSFANTAPLTIPAGAPGSTAGVAAPYPAVINVSGIITPVGKITTTLTSVAHTFPDDLDILLVGPGGQKVMLMSDAGGGTDITAATLTFDDAAAGTVPDGGPIPLAGGTFRPTDFSPGETLPAPAPGGPYGTALSVFNGVDPDGTWSLYVNDDATQDSGRINGGWRLGITPLTPNCVAAPPILINYLPIIIKN